NLAVESKIKWRTVKADNRFFAARFLWRTGRETGPGIKTAALDEEKRRDARNLPHAPGGCAEFSDKIIGWKIKRSCLKKNMEKKDVLGMFLSTKVWRQLGRKFLFM